jgi:hypothetical protein
MAAGVVAAPHERRPDDGAVRVPARHLARPVGKIREHRARHVRPHGSAEGGEQPDRIVEEAALDERVADAGEHFLLAGRPGDIGFAGRLADAGVRERGPAIEVVASFVIMSPRDPYSS